MKSISKREQVMAIAVGGIIVLLISVALLAHFFKTTSNLRLQIANKEKTLKIEQQLLANRDRWKHRDVWLKANIPKLANADSAGVDLFNTIKKVAAKADVQVEKPSIGSVSKSRYFQSVAVDLDTKSSWEALIHFLYQVQQEKFLVFQTAKIEVESDDPTKMHGKFKIAKWYAP